MVTVMSYGFMFLLVVGSTECKVMGLVLIGSNWPTINIPVIRLTTHSPHPS